MSVYRKDDNGNIKKIAGSLTQRINMHIFQTTHEFDTEKNEDNYIINESDAKPYISSIKDWTQYSINLSEPNESSNINIKLGSQTLKLINSVKNIEIGTLNGVIQCHTEKLDNSEIFLDVVGTVVSVNGEEKTSINTDITPTANSNNLITSGGVHDYPAIAFAESERQKSKNLFNINNTVLDYSLNLGETGHQLYIESTSTESYGRCCTNINNLIKVKPNTQYVITNNSTFKYSVGQITASRLVVRETGWKTDSTLTITTGSGIEYIAFNFGKIDDSKITNSEFSDFLLSHIQVEEGSVVTNWQPYDGEIVHNGDHAVEFAEKEYQKSKNLIPYPYHDGNSIVSNGITFTVNNDQSISVSGSIIDHNSNAVIWLAWDMPLKAGTYRISDSNSGNDLSVVAWIGNDYYQKDVNNGMFTLSLDATAKIYLQIAKGSTKTYNDTVSFMLCEGTDTDWQPYNGAIVHDKEIADVEHIKTIYDMSSSDSNINWGKSTGIKASGQVEGVLSFTSPIALNVNKKYRIYVNWGGDMNSFDVVKNQHTNRMSGCSAVWAYQLYAEQLQMCEFYYLSDTNQIQLRFRKLSPSGTSIEIQTSEYVYITKIEEIS